jgi:hypothetical protein
MGGIMMPYMSTIGQQGYIVPSNIPNLTLWYNASASATVVNGVSTNNFQGAVVNGSAVSKWIDLSGLGQPANTNGGAGRNPTYTIPIQNGLGAVGYVASNQTNLDINPSTWSNGLAGYTVYVMARPTSFPATAFPLMVSDQSSGMWWNGTNWSVGMSIGNRGTVTITNDTNTFHIYGLVFDGSQTGNANRLTFRYDKAAKTLTFTGTIPAVTPTNQYWFVGGDNRSGGSGGALSSTYMDGDIGEVLIWTRTLSSSEIASVEAYLNQKWGLGLA